MSIQQWSESELQTAIQAGDPLLVDLQADWCVQCGPQENVIKRLVPEFADRVIFASIDVEQYPAVTTQFNVSGLPTLLLFKDGRLHEILRGFKRAPLVRIALNKLLQ